MHRTATIPLSPIAAVLLSALAGCGSLGSPAPDAATGREVTISPRGDNVVATWGQVAFKAIGSTNQDLVTVHLAMYDAVMAIARTHQPYAIRPATSGAGAARWA